MNKRWLNLIMAPVLLAMMAGCAAPAPQVIEKEVTRVVKETVVQEKEVEKIVTKEVVVEPTATPAKTAKYIFVFIGDGMGVAQRNAAELYLAATTNADARPEDTVLLMNTFPAQGMNTTYDLTSVIPDSASTATSLASGEKTASGVIGMDPDGKVAFKLITEMAKEAGLKVGIVTSVSIDHATPAAFYAHNQSRKNMYDIALDLIGSGFDYFGGGALVQPTGKEGDQPDAYALATDAGFTVVNTRAGFDGLTAASLPAWAVTPNPKDSQALAYEMDREEDDISLTEFVSKGIALLDNPNGFIMMVEGGKIDWACHANDAAASVMDTLEFDNALREAYAFYEQHPDETLIVVTGDHETGGMTIGFAGTEYTSNIGMIGRQTMSQTAFNDVIAAYKETHTVETAKLEDLYADLEAAFGVEFLSADELAALTAKAEAGDAAAKATLAVAVSELEMEVIQQAFAASMAGEEVIAADPHTYLLYGGYDPLAIKMTTILNQKAGIAWTSYSHTGVPVQTSAIGVNAEAFNGYYDNTDIFTKMVEAAAL